MRKLTWTPTRRTWILIFGLLAAMAVGFWTLKQGARRAETARPAASAPASPEVERARQALQKRVGGDPEVLYAVAPAGSGAVCGYYAAAQTAREDGPTRAASFVYRKGELVLTGDLAGPEYVALQKSACGAGWTGAR